MYGLESVQINDSLKKYLDIFQIKAYRNILGLDHTYIDRTNTNAKIMEEANNAINQNTAGGTNPIMKLSEYFEKIRTTLTAQIICNRHRR